MTQNRWKEWEEEKEEKTKKNIYRLFVGHSIKSETDRRTDRQTDRR